jgi:hypothetical protein|tara:strand:+ start:26 stop:424 length:399 start_codon:yes stop_codon:yes gene_type:complete
MESVNFKVNKEGVVKEITVDTNTSIEGLKETIKEEYEILSYIDIDFQIEKPMRVLGKFNVEPGILARTFDRHELEKFGIKGEINLTFHEVKGYTPYRNNSIKLDFKKYSIGSLEDTTANFNIDSDADFPKLG